MIGIVVVSHSHALASAAVALAAEMVDADGPRVELAAGLDETTFGTDAAAVAEAIDRADSRDGVLVLVDLGSALLSTDLALEFVDPDLAARTRISAAPLVEGLVAAVVTAATGASLDDVEREARSGLAGKQDHLGVATDDQPEAGAGADVPMVRDTVTITNPHGLHARPAATLVGLLADVDGPVQLRNATTGKGPVDARSLTRVATLGLLAGHRMEIAAADPRAIEVLRAAAADAFGERAEPAPITAAATDPDVDRSGLELVLAPAVVRRSTVDHSGYSAGDPAVEQDRLGAAFTAVDERLATLSSAPDGGAVFAAQRVLAGDRELQDGVRARVAAGASAPSAVAAEFDSVASEFEALDDAYQRERAVDVRSVSGMLQRALVGAPDPVEVTTEHVLVVDELDAVTAAGLDPATTPAVVTRHGGATGHGALVAAARGIAVVTGRPEAAVVHDGQLLAVDPRSGSVEIDPAPDRIEALRVTERERTAELADARAHAAEPAVTTAGVRVLVEANVASPADAERGAREGADGSGLVRTELLFADRTSAPDAAEQAALFVRIGRALDAPITVRTWDVGGDKPLPFLPQAREANPFLGERGLRTMRRTPDLFAEQLRALVRAAAEVELRILLPMVTDPDEIAWAREQLAAIDATSQIPLGMMVEVPAAAVRAADFAGLVDFVSIGTNDLTQYVTAADRGNDTVASLARPGHPAVLDLVERTAAALPGLPVAVCGDLAGNTDFTAELVRRGVTELSVRPPAVPLVKAAVRRC